MSSTDLVQRLWSYSNILWDVGLSYVDWVEQSKCLLFLKKTDEQSRPPFSKPSRIPLIPFAEKTPKVPEVEWRLNFLAVLESLVTAELQCPICLRHSFVQWAFNEATFEAEKGAK